MASDFNLKALSSGLGLGSLQAAKPKRTTSFLPSPPSAPMSHRPERPQARVQVPLDINPSLEERQALSPPQAPMQLQPNPSQFAARVAYKPHAVGTQLRKEPRTRVAVWFVRALVGWGFDLFVVALTLVVTLVSGTLAWRVGSGVPDATDPFSAVAHVINMGIYVGPLGLIAAFALTFFIYWGLMKLVIGSTIGSALQR